MAQIHVIPQGNCIKDCFVIKHFKRSVYTININTILIQSQNSNSTQLCVHVHTSKHTEHTHLQAVSVYNSHPCPCTEVLHQHIMHRAAP